MKKYSKYLIEEAERIDIRYYKIKIRGKYFIVDYSNPRDIRNYFPGLFPEVTSKWNLIPVELIKNTERINGIIKIRNGKVKWEVIAFLVYLFNVMFFPNKYNLSNLTYHSNIRENWLLTMILVFTGAIVIFLCLFIIGSKYKFDGVVNSYLIKIENENKKHSSKVNLIRIFNWLVSYTLIIVLFGLVGIGSSSYSQLIVFFIIPIYGLLFSKFLTFEPIRSKSKYKIIEKEEK